jgi:ectoine hydroxylase-related dioxygenase (phytanoyl-CoA dioxygenase family)
MEVKETAAELSERKLAVIADDVKRDGIGIIRGLFDKTLINEWAAAFNELFESRKSLPGGLAPREQSRFYLTLPWVKPFADQNVFANPAVLGVLDQLFAQEYRMVQFGVDTPVFGSDYQEIHRDHRPLFTDEIVTPLYSLAVNIPLVDITEENGPFQMARGTHRAGRADGLAKIARGEIRLESFLVERGDVIIRTPLALHRGSPNRTGTPRPMVVMGWVMHWLHTPKVDLTIPRDFYESLPENIQTLLRCSVADRIEDRAETYLNFKY